VLSFLIAFATNLRHCRPGDVTVEFLGLFFVSHNTYYTDYSISNSGSGHGHSRSYCCCCCPWWCCHCSLLLLLLHCRPGNVTVEFLGPFFVSHDTYTDYYFTCQLTVSRVVAGVLYDVVLMFDGERDHRLPVKVATAAAPNVKFTPSDFGRHFGQLVGYQSSRYMSQWCRF